MERNIQPIFEKHVQLQNFWLKTSAINQQEAVQICVQQYQKIYCHFPQQRTSKEIPKIIHFIWIGSKPQPKAFTEFYFKQWTDSHREYEFRIWGEEDLLLEEFENSEIIRDKTLNPGFRADALRLELLLKYGGIYVDVDMALIKPLDGLLELDLDFFIGVSNTKAFELNNAILGSIPQHPLIKHLIEQLKLSIKQQQDQIEKNNKLMQAFAGFDPSLTSKLGEMKVDLKQVNVIQTSGPGFMTRQIFSYLKLNGQSSNAFIAPPHLFFPLSNTLRDSISIDSYSQMIKENVTQEELQEVLTCHMWDYNWDPQKK